MPQQITPPADAPSTTPPATLDLTDPAVQATLRRYLIAANGRITEAQRSLDDSRPAVRHAVVLNWARGAAGDLRQFLDALGDEP